MARHRTGSVYQRSIDGRWVAAFKVDRPGDRPVHRLFYGRTEDEARAKAAAAGMFKQPKPLPYVREHEPPLRIGGSLRLRIAQAVLARARDKGWDDDFTARVMVASFTTSRASRGIVGPCVYCGDELAGTVDHVRPRARGGKDIPANVVSACAGCNERKGRMARRTFTSLRPSDKRRTCDCGHRYKRHLYRDDVGGGRCDEMVWHHEQQSLVLCPCQKWEPSPVQYPALTG